MSSYKSKVFSLSIGKFAHGLITVAIAMIFSRILSKVDLSTYRQTLLAYNFFTPILTLGIPATIFYFLPQEKKRERGVILDNITILFILGIIFTIFLFFGGTELLAARFNNPNLLKTLKWLIFYPLYTFPALGLTFVLIVYNKTKLVAVYEILSNLVMAVLILSAVVLTASYEHPLIIKIAFPLFTLPVLLYLVFTTVKKGFDFPRIKEMKKAVEYGVPFGLSSIIAALSLQLDKVIVSSMCNPEEFAVYSNGAMEVPVVGIITGSIATVIISDMRRHCAENDYASALRIFRKSASVSAMVLLPVMCFLLVFSEGFIEFMFSSKYIESIIPFRVYLFTLPIRIAHYGSAFLALGLKKEVLWKTAGNFIFNAVMSVILVYYIGSIGAAISTVLSLYLWSVPVNLKILSRSFKTSPWQVLPFREIFHIFSVSLVAVFFTLPVKFINLSNVLQFFVGGVLFVIVYSAMAYRFFPDASKFVKQFLKGYIFR
ncbi:MAG TPA: oligosaccharide flippase family protein [bacterium]|nr:oligosaccharide flippase family protein [bacterium]